MAKLFNLTMLTPDEVIYEGRVSSLVAPCDLGYLGVLANHAPLVANMKSGKIILKEETGSSIIFNSAAKGFLQVLKNKVTIILNSNLITGKVK